MNRTSAITITVIIVLAIIGLIAWSLTMRNTDTTQDTAQNKYSSATTIPQEDISVDSSIDTDIGTLEQELQGL